MTRPVDIVIVTTLEEEREAVLRKLQDIVENALRTDGLAALLDQPMHFPQLSVYWQRSQVGHQSKQS
mgnify:CR=1 FL=1